MSEGFVSPKLDADGFTCPACALYAHQTWHRPHVAVTGERAQFRATTKQGAVSLSVCFKCRNAGIWAGASLVYPRTLAAPKPNDDMPAGVERAYEEARAVVGDSPRAAAALLRLSVELLVDQLTGKALNPGIGQLVKEGMPERIQKALDALRVIGNNAVHPGQIELTDDADTALALFRLVNLIVEDRLTEARRIDELYAMIPEGALEAIERRDKKD